LEAEAAGLRKLEEIQKAAALQKVEGVESACMTHRIARRKHGKTKLKVAACTDNSHGADLASSSSHHNSRCVQEATSTAVVHAGGILTGPQGPVHGMDTTLQREAGEPHRKVDAFPVNSCSSPERSRHILVEGRTDTQEGLQGLLGIYGNSSDSDAEEVDH
jgi:hypothetical protein